MPPTRLRMILRGCLCMTVAVEILNQSMSLGTLLVPSIELAEMSTLLSAMTSNSTRPDTKPETDGAFNGDNDTSHTTNDKEPAKTASTENLKNTPDSLQKTDLPKKKTSIHIPTAPNDGEFTNVSNHTAEVADTTKKSPKHSKEKQLPSSKDSDGSRGSAVKTPERNATLNPENKATKAATAVDSDWTKPGDNRSEGDRASISVNLIDLEVPLNITMVSRRKLPDGYISVDPPPAQDEVCGGCLLAKVTKNDSCGTFIHKSMEKNNLTFVEAAKKTAKEFINCHRCHPGACSDADKRYYRFDHAAPTINYGRSHLLPSIPAEHRIPKYALDDLEKYFSDRNNTVPHRKYFFEYNPSIAELPDDQIPKLSFKHEPIVYLVSHRVSRIQRCVPDELIKPDDPEQPIHEEYLGFAFLDKNFSVVADLTVNPKDGNFAAQDFRIFNLKGQLYLTGFKKIVRLWVNPSAKPNTTTSTVKDMFGDPNNYGLTLTFQKFYSCCAAKTCEGKNFNYFIGPDGEMMAETSPISPHIVDIVDMDHLCRESRYIGKNTSIQTHQTPQPSFFNNMERYFANNGVYTQCSSDSRGSAGFVEVDVPAEGSAETRTLLVGASHVKLFNKGLGNVPVDMKDRTYYSFFYAFEPRPPYEIVARSGAFCLGFPTKDEEKENYMAPLVHREALYMDGEQNCPVIHFIMGLIDKAGDPGRVIISYGINDCISRIVEIDKSEVVRLLLHPSGKLKL